jgi:hypothetical protein
MGSKQSWEVGGVKPTRLTFCYNIVAKLASQPLQMVQVSFKLDINNALL